MCLYINRYVTEQLKELTGPVIVYKVFRQCGSVLVSPVFDTPLDTLPCNYPSDRRSRELTEEEAVHLHIKRGIHVFFNYEAARDYCNFDTAEVIVWGIAKWEDFVAAEHTIGRLDGVFMEVDFKEVMTCA